MYIVTTKQIPNFPVPSIVLMTSDPLKALTQARSIKTENIHHDVPATVARIYEVVEDKNYSLEPPIVYSLLCQSSKDNVFLWSETFYKGFKGFNLERITCHRIKDKIAEQGKFRAVIQLDSDNCFRIDEDTTREQAYELCLQYIRGSSSIFFQVYDDLGNAHVQNGQLKDSLLA